MFLFEHFIENLSPLERHTFSGVSTFDDLIVYISCNSLLDNGLEDAIYSERSDKFKCLNKSNQLDF